VEFKDMGRSEQFSDPSLLTTLWRQRQPPYGAIILQVDGQMAMSPAPNNNSVDFLSYNMQGDHEWRLAAYFFNMSNPQTPLLVGQVGLGRQPNTLLQLSVHCGGIGNLCNPNLFCDSSSPMPRPDGVLTVKSSAETSTPPLASIYPYYSVTVDQDAWWNNHIRVPSGTVEALYLYLPFVSNSDQSTLSPSDDSLDITFFTAGANTGVIITFTNFCTSDPPKLTSSGDCGPVVFRPPS
jgi:hypothetical protein